MHNSCLDRTEFFPPEAPRWCDQKPTSTFAQICCYDRDMCNDGLRPELTSNDSESDVTVEGSTGNLSTVCPHPIFFNKCRANDLIITRKYGTNLGFFLINGLYCLYHNCCFVLN